MVLQPILHVVQELADVQLAQAALQQRVHALEGSLPHVQPIIYSVLEGPHLHLQEGRTWRALEYKAPPLDLQLTPPAQHCILAPSHTACAQASGLKHSLQHPLSRLSHSLSRQSVGYYVCVSPCLTDNIFLEY